MTKALRHRCRNPHCGMKLSAPVENEHHAFCTRGCFNRFYFNRCRVCEKDLRKKGKRGDANRLYCRPPNDCSAQARKWPEKYEYGVWDVPHTNNVRSAHSTGLKFGLRTHLSSLHCLRECWWGGDGEHDHSLYGKDGLTLALLVLGNARYHLRTPITVRASTLPNEPDEEDVDESLFPPDPFGQQQPGGGPKRLRYWRFPIESAILR
jgi:hypothetical protein